MRKLVLALSIALMATTAKAQCLQIESILVDACNAVPPCPVGATEGQNEMVLFQVGPTALTIAYGTTVAAKLTPTWPNNSFLGWQAPGAITNPLVSALNATIVKCGYLKEPVGGVLPAGYSVLIITSTAMCTAGNSFANLTDTLYVIFQVAGNTAGHFANNDNTGTITTTPTGTVSTRTMTLAYTGIPSCSESVTYDRSLLVNEFGTYGGTAADNDGSTVEFDAAGNPTYVNNGCQAPYIPIQITVTAPAPICSNSTVTISGTVSGPATTYSWTSNGTGTVSIGTGTLSASGTTTVNTVYTPGSGESGTVTFTLTAHGKCSLAVVTNTVTLTINPAPTPVISSSGGATICNGVSTVLTATNAGATTYTWSPGGSTATSITVSPTNTTTPTVYTVSAHNACGTTPATFTVTVNPQPTITIPDDSICKGTTGTLVASGANTYTWNTSVVSPTLSIPNVTTNATYTVTGTSATGCTNTAVGNIIVRNPPLITVNSPTICAGSTSTLTASGANTYTWNTGTTAASTTVNPTVSTDYTVTGTDVHSCTATATSTVTVNPTPTLTITPNASTICSGGSTTLTAIGANTYTWTPASTLSNPNTANPIASPTTTTVYSVTGTNAGGCTNTIPAIVTVSVTASPALSLAGNSYTICNGSSQTFTASGASTYTWTPTTTLINPNTANPTASPTATTIYTVSGTASGCAPSAPLTLTLTINPLPTYSLTSPTYTICSGSSQAISVSGASSYTWTPAINLTNPNIANPTANPTTTTVYNVTGTNANGCTNTTPATVTVSVNPTPTYSLTGNAYTICSGGSQTFTVSGASTYTWIPTTNLTNPNTANPTASPTTTTVYSVTGTNANGCTNTTPAIVTVNVASSPALSLTASSFTICNGSSQTFTASGASTYTWTPATTLTGANTANPVANPTTTTIYTVSGTASGCAPSAPLTLTLTINPLPTYSLTSPTYTICNGSSQALSVSGASSYTWTPTTNLTNPNIANPTASPTSTTVYSVTGTNASGCSNTTPATVTISVNPTPTYSLTGNAYTICSGSSQTFTVSGASTYTWTPPTNLTNPNTANPTASPTITTTYSVTGTNTSGCINATPAIVTVNVTTTPTLNLATNSYTLCEGSSQALSVNGASSYTWTPATTLTNPNTANPTASPTTTTIYTVNGTSGGCMNAIPSTVTVAVNALPTLTISPASLSICIGQSATLSASGANTYTWSTGATPTSTISVSPASSGVQTYSVSGTDVNGCVSSISAVATVIVNSLPTITIASIPSGYTVCAGNTTTLTASGASTYTWSNGDMFNTNVVSPITNPTSYTVIGTDINNCVNSSTVSVSVIQPLSMPTITGNTVVCWNTPTVLTATVNGVNYIWIGPAPSTNTVSSSSSASITTPGTYTLIATNVCGNSQTIETLIGDSVKAHITSPVSPSTGFAPDTVAFIGQGTSTNGTIIGYHWNFGNGDTSNIQNPSEIYTAPSLSVNTYTAILTTIDNNGCWDTASVKIIVNEVPTIVIIPNIFSPNGDNINDIFFITATGISNFDCKVYDRWGLLLHEWTGIDGGWDGKSKNGNNCTDGTYFYIINYNDNQGKSVNKDGFFELVR